MKNFIGYFSYYMVLNTAFFTVIFSIYFIFNYSFNASLKLGLIYGFIVSIFISTILSIVAMSRKSIQTYANKQQELREKESFKKIEDIEVPIEINMAKEEPNNLSNIKNKSTDITLFLLIDKNLAFNILVQLVIENKTWKIEARDKNKNTFTIITPKQNIYLSVQSLTENTSKVKIKNNGIGECIKTLLKYIKQKEQSFLDY